MRCFNFLKYWVLCIVLLMSAGAYAHPLGGDTACPTPQQSGLTQVELDQFRLAGLCYTLDGRSNVAGWSALGPGKFKCAGQDKYKTSDCLCAGTYSYSDLPEVPIQISTSGESGFIRNIYGQCVALPTNLGPEWDAVFFRSLNLFHEVPKKSYYYEDEKRILGSFRAGTIGTKTNPICVNGLSYDEVAQKCICPAGTSLTNGICVDDRVVCQKTPHICNRCPATSDKAGSSYIGADISAGCCFPGKTWNGNSCISCPSGASGNYPACQCPRGPYNRTNNTCDTCPNGKTWNGTSCVTDPSCPAGASGNYPACQCPRGPYNRTNNTCDTCPSGKVWNGFFCDVPCPSGATGMPPNCQCPSGYYYDSSKNTCDTCPGGKIRVGNACVCPSGTTWNAGSNKCECKNGATNPSSCDICPADKPRYLEGTCTTCPSGTTWNGSSCVIDSCPADQVLINGKCTPIPGLCTSGIFVCSGGGSPTYDSEKKKCVCPACSVTKTKCAISSRRVY